MTTPTVMIVNHDPALQAEVEQRCADAPYDVIVHSHPQHAQQALDDETPAAVVVHLPSDAPPEQEQALIAQLQDDANARQLPVVVCSDRPALLQSAVRTLQQRPGAVHASTNDVEELLVKLDALDVGSSSSPA